MLGLSSTVVDSVSSASDRDFEWFIEVRSETSLVSSTLSVDTDNLLSSILAVDKDILLPLLPGDVVADGALLLPLLSRRSTEEKKNSLSQYRKIPTIIRQN